jgi:hypothetical protein
MAGAASGLMGYAHAGGGIGAAGSTVAHSVPAITMLIRKLLRGIIPMVTMRSF